MRLVLKSGAVSLRLRAWAFHAHISLALSVLMKKASEILTVWKFPRQRKRSISAS